MSDSPDVPTADADADPQEEGRGASPSPSRSSGASEAADGLTAAADELAGAGEQGWRSRSSTVRRPRRVIRGGGGSGLPSVTDEPERVRIRSAAAESVGRREASPADAASSQGVSETPMLDADGQVIRSESMVEQVAAEDAGAPGCDGAQSVDAGTFLADAVRSYLAGVDTLGANHEVTSDRRDRLRQTLKLWDRGSLS